MRSGGRARALIGLALGLLLAGPARAASPGAACEAAGLAAEAANGIPHGLLLAIGRVESGRYAARLGRVTPWPWAVDVVGTGALFDSRRAALATARGAVAAGQRNVDLGCFQVNLAAHPDAFSSLRQALVPAANAAYAGAFLARLHAQLGSWRAAAATYHSQTAALGAPYLRAVLASWADPGATLPVALGAGPGQTGDPTWGGVTKGAGMQPITPGSAPASAEIGPVVHVGWPAGIAR